MSIGVQETPLPIDQHKLRFRGTKLDAHKLRDASKHNAEFVEKGADDPVVGLSLMSESLKHENGRKQPTNVTRLPNNRHMFS